MKRLDAMLTAAMDGSFSEKAFAVTTLLGKGLFRQQLSIEPKVGHRCFGLMGNVRDQSADLVFLCLQISRGNPAKPDYLKTVYGIGYTWAVRL